MPIEIEDPKEEDRKKAEAAKKKKKAAAAAAAAEEEETIGQKRELWPLIPAIPVVIAIILSVIPEKADVNEFDLERGKCVNQLRTVSFKKETVAKELDLEEGDELPQEEIDKILAEVKCPRGATIQVRPIGYEPRCSMHGTLSSWVQEQQNIGYWEKTLRGNEK